MINSFETEETLCDRLDNDCDRKIDENLQDCCGDGNKQGLEECDDGNLREDDYCTNDCRSIICGDGIIRGHEECEDGNLLNNDLCSSQCKFFPCGGNCPSFNWKEIPSGQFNMGAELTPDGMPSPTTSPVHPVAVNQPFWMSQSEITVAQYWACVLHGPCPVPCQSTDDHCNWTATPSAFDAHPVNYVSWRQARAFARWVGGELPSEAQWEYAATSLGQNIFYTWGNSIQSPTCYYANFFSGASFCAPEGTTPVCTSALGNTDQDLCDMIGNVQEWVLDDRHVSYEQAPANEQAWCIDVGICTQENLKTMRGGSWLSSQLSISTRYRPTTNQEYRIFDLGFRVIRPH